jgi:hypothetical protein
MRPSEMVAHCQQQIALAGPLASAGFVMPRSWLGQRRMRLAGKGSPWGEPVGHVNGGTYVMFSAAEVLAWLAEAEGGR